MLNEPLGEGAGMFRNKQALQIGCFLGRHLLIFRDGEEDVRFILPPSRKSTLSQDFSKPPHFVRLSVCPSV